MGVRRISFISEVQQRRVRHMIGISADMAVCTDYAFSGHPVLNHPQLGHVVAVFACDACADIVKVLTQMIRCNDRIKAQRSEERSVGKECVSSYRSRGAP